MSEMPYVAMAELNLAAGSTLPIKTSTKQEDIPLFGSVLGYLAKVPTGEAAYIQWVVRTTSQHGVASHVRSKMFSVDAEGKQIASTYKSLMEEKLKSPLVEVQARILYGANSHETCS
jgi:hypothetical protein